MKKFLIAFALTCLAACSALNLTPTPATPQPTPVPLSEKPQPDAKGCSVKGVDEKGVGKFYYDHGHHLYSYVELNKAQGDRCFNNVKDAQAAGFKEAPRHFTDSTYTLITCLHNESEDGECHHYIGGVYKSLEIYDKVCGGDVSKAELASVVEKHANEVNDGLDVSKYDGVSTALLHKYACHGGK